MAATFERPRPRAIHPVHAIMLAGTLPLFLGALLSDIAYAQTFQVQWTNFASWLIVGGLLFGGVALVLALIGLLRAHRSGRYRIYFVLVLATWVLGFINALMHAKDVWAVMPEGPVLSAVVTVLACAAIWAGFSGPRVGEAP